MTSEVSAPRPWLLCRAATEFCWRRSRLPQYNALMNTTLVDRVVTSSINSPVGPLLVGATDNGICLLEFAEPARQEAQLATLRQQFVDAIEPGRHEHLERLAEELAEYFAGTRRDFTVPVVVAGTPFQQRVWQQLQRIPYGATCSYEDVARAIGNANAVRAVGRANGQNRVAIVIPCHRVVNKGGGLGGYGGGLGRKQLLLDLERRA
jgi:AraC family transcriptional regulator of adaptative response/methylated-DNA-[protein]-cysteine methyltransferase